MEWIWNYVFALLTSHSITQMDSCRHGCWAKLVTLSPNNIAITKSHTNYGHIGIFIGAWAWQPKQCPLGESGVGSLCLTMVLSPLSDIISGAGWGMDLLCLPHRPGPWPVSAVTSQWPDPDKCPIIFTAVSTIWYESHSSGLAALLSVSSVENQMGSCLSSCPRRVRDKLICYWAHLSLSVWWIRAQCNKSLWPFSLKCRGWLLEVNKVI